MPTERVLIRNSERTLFKRCRQAWWWSYVEQLKPQTEAAPLRFGTLIHKSLEEYYSPLGVKRGVHPAKTFLKLFDKAQQDMPAFGFRIEGVDEDDEETSAWQNARELGKVMLEGYVSEFRQRDREYEIISTEQTFAQDVHHKVTGKYLFTAVGTFDILARHKRRKTLVLWDFKTAKAIKVTHLPLDEQASTYWTYGPMWMADNGLLRPNEMPTHIVYRFLRKALPDPRPRNEQGHCLNENGSVSKRQPAPLFHEEWVYRDVGDRRMLDRRVRAEMLDMEKLRGMRSGRRIPAAIYKNPGPFTCMGCAFRDPCELHEVGADYKAILRTFVRWDPYDAHEIATERHR